MAPRLLAQQFSSFLAFYSCSKHLSSRSFVTARPRRSYNPSALVRKSRTLEPKRHFHASNRTCAPKNPYEVLGVKKDATAADIKKSYFALARKFHPDTNPDKNAREKFVEIQEAYDTLKDDKKRAAYDQYGSASQQQGFDPNAFSRGGFGGGFGGGPFGGFSGGRSGFQDFSEVFGGGRGGRGQADLFEELFGAFGGGGRGPRASANMRGSDIETSLNIDFLQACKGTTKKVTVQPVVDCGTCSGSGLKKGSSRTTCGTCGGSGERTFVIQGGFQMASTCNACDGVGSTIPRSGQCSSCGGAGKVRVKKVVDVKIPAGIEDGMTIRVPNAGDAPISGSGPVGDLLVRVHVARSNVFQRQGSNIYFNANIPFYTALLGGRVRVPTLDGDVDVRIPGGTQPGEEMVLKGRGVSAVYGSGTGDLFVKFSVSVPRSLSKRQRELIQAYADEVEGKTPKSTTPNTSSPSSSTSDNPTSKKPDDHKDGKVKPNSEKAEEKSGVKGDKAEDKTEPKSEKSEDPKASSS